MARTLTQLPKTAFSGLDYDNIIVDVINLVKDNPDYNINWDDFLSSDAGRMLTELFAYITDQLATRVDWVVNEGYLSTATQKRSVMRLLKIIGYNFTLPVAASVVVDVTTGNSSYPGPYYLTAAYDSVEGTLSPFSLPVTDTTGSATTFELISYDSVTEEYDYKIGVKVESASTELNFYEGVTYVEDFTATTDNGYTFTLTNSPVIEGSIRVYFINGVTEEEMLKVNSFLDPEAQAEEDDDGNDYGIPYVLEVNEDETVTVETGTTALLTNSNRRLAENDVAKVFYRVGGGTNGNVPAQSINTTKTLSVEVVAGGDTIVQLTGGTGGAGLINNSQGTGGTAGETADHAATYAPLQLRTSNKAVSAEDYDTLLNAHNNILTAKVYGNSNVPSTVFTEYGVYLNPFDVWIYAIPDSSSWSSYNASRYNDIEWISLRLQNMFNNIHSFRSGQFNFGDTYLNTAVAGKTIIGDTIDWDGSGTGDTQHFRNYLVLDTPTNFKAAYAGNSNARIKVTTVSDTNQSFDNLTNIVVGELTVGDTVGDSILTLRGDTYAYFQSLIDIETGVDLSIKKWIKVNIDYFGDTSIDLSNGAIDTSSVKPDEIAAAINLKLALLPAYGLAYGDSTTGKTGVASVVRPDASTSYIKITSPKSGDTSIVYFKDNVVPAGDSDATTTVFGSTVAGDTYVNYGWQRLTLVTNSIETNYQKLIFENGSINLDATSDDYYVHYVSTVGDTIQLGDYFYDTYGGAAPTDPLWRNKAARIYNNVEYGDTGDSVDPFNSNFELRFTDTATTSMSLYNITNNWNVVEAIRPRIQSTAFVTSSLDGDTIITLDSSSYAITFNIDGLGDSYVDVTGDLGIVGDTYGYTIDDVITQINTQLRSTYGTGYGAGAPYDTFTYAKRGDTYPQRIIIESPTATNNSYVAIKAVGDTNYASEDLNFVVDEYDGDSHYWYPTGDYYLHYNSTRDAMDLIKLNATQLSSGETPDVSIMPDGNFYSHFIWDRRGDTGLGETTYQNYLNNAKIIGVENIFKQTRFTPFYISGTIYYNADYSKALVKDTVETAITENYSFVDSSNVIKRDYGRQLSKSEVLKTILDIDGVEYMEFSYFGPDSTDSTTNVTNTIDVEFDEILILHEAGISLIYTVMDE
jgi:hypothetical protein